MYRLIILFLLLVACQSTPKKDQEKRGFISLTPSITETVYAIGAGDQLLAVTDFCNWPPEVNKKERIGGFLNPNLEKIIRLRPDVLLGLPSHQDLAAKLEPYNLEVIMISNETISDVIKTIDTLGVLTGRTDEASALKRALKDSLDMYQADQAVSAHAMLIIGREEGPPRNITVAGPGSFINEIWERTGGKNIFADLENQYSMVSREAVLTRNPDIIIEFRQLDDADTAMVTRLKKEWRDLGLLSAVQQEHVYLLTGDYCLIPGPRMYLLARDFRDILNKYNNLN